MRNAFIRFACLVSAAITVQASDLFVAPNGSDFNSGTKDQPFATLESARNEARKMGVGLHRIILLSGDYFLSKPFEIDSRDNGLTLESKEAGGASLYGGTLIKGWQRDGEKFWSASLPQRMNENWDFRALIVNGQMADRSRMPELGSFEYKNKFDVQWLSSVGGGWARQPTQKEFTCLRYDPKNIPLTFNVRNAEVRVYHMWNESLVGVVTNDTEQHTLILEKPSHPLGAFGVNKFVIFNTREGMSRPGQWYFDRSTERLVYWPLPGEDMTKARVVVPVLERIISIVGNSNSPVEKITIRGLNLQATTTPLKPGGFAAELFDGALHIEEVRECLVDSLEIANVSGQGIWGQALTSCEIRNCQIHNTGGCAIRVSGSDTLITHNRLYQVGLIYPSAVALVASHDSRFDGEKGLHIYRNEIHDTSYSGIDCSGDNFLVEENLIYHVMRELSDGGAIYGMMSNSILRGNYIRSVSKMVEGFGVSSFYLDEGSENCVVEHNLSIGVERPTHMHIAHNINIRNNVFAVETNMLLSFQGSSDCIFSGNTIFVPGQIKIERPPGIRLWTNNIIFRGGSFDGGSSSTFTIDDAMPFMSLPAHLTTPINIGRVAQAPTLNGEIDPNEWPYGARGVNREPSRWDASGGPAIAFFAYDDQCLYVAIRTTLFDFTKLRKGSTWGQDDGVEIALAGDKGTFVLHGFANGTIESLADAGISMEAATQFGKKVHFTAKTYGKIKGDWKSGWCCEWSIPFSALGIKPSNGQKMPFNICIYRAEDEAWRCLEGTRAENWRLDQAATLQFIGGNTNNSIRLMAQ